MKVLSWRTCLHKDLTLLAEQAGEVGGAEHRSLCFVEVLEEEEVASDVEAAIASYMTKRGYQAGGN